jgi:hypothetical protein
MVKELNSFNVSLPFHVMLRSILLEWSRDGSLPSVRVISNNLSKMRGRVFGHRAIDYHTYLGNRYWYVRKIQPPKSGDSGDSGDSAHTPRLREDTTLNLTGVKEWGVTNVKEDAPRARTQGGAESHQSHQSHQAEGEQSGSIPNQGNREVFDV